MVSSSFFMVAALLALCIAYFAMLDVDVFASLVTALIPSSPKHFQGQVIWIVGASSGIGAQLARDLVKEGAQVIISARREKELQEVATSCLLQEEGVHSKEKIKLLPPLVLPLDITDFEAQAAMLKQILDTFGHIDSLVLSSGRSQRSLAENFSISSTKELFELNVFSFINLATLIVPHMIQAKKGQIVVLSSVSGKIPTPISSSYSSTKYALHGYFDALRTEVAQFGIHILMVCPGPVVSEITTHAMKSSSVQTVVAESEGKKMPTERCTALMVKGMKYKDLISEIWISDQPILFLTYLSAYLPWLNRLLFTKVLHSFISLLFFEFHFIYILSDTCTECLLGFVVNWAFQKECTGEGHKRL